jgi:hypothetical protein
MRFSVKHEFCLLDSKKNLDVDFGNAPLGIRITARCPVCGETSVIDGDDETDRSQLGDLAEVVGMSIDEILSMDPDDFRHRVIETPEYDRWLRATVEQFRRDETKQ